MSLGLRNGAKGGQATRAALGLVLTLSLLLGLLAVWGLWLSPQDAPRPVDALFVPNGDPDYARTAKAITLYQQGLAKWLIVSGQGVGGDSAPEMARRARTGGIPASAILSEPHATSTRENARLTAPLLPAHHIRSILIISSPYHLRRMKLAAKAAWPGVAIYTCRDDEPFTPWWWTSENARRTVGEETWKLLGYAAAGWLWPLTFGAVR